MKRSRKYRTASEKIDSARTYTIENALELVKNSAFAKFDETIDMAINLNINKNHSVRDTLLLPHQFAAEKRVIVFAKGSKAREAEEAGATLVGAEELVQKVKEGWIDFDICVAAPDMMKDVGKLGPVLGRRGMMPNPKTKTVTMDVAAAVKELKRGRTEFRADKGGVVHMAVGKVSMDSSAVKENIETVMSELKRKRPSDLKGEFICAAALASTMGPGLKLEIRE